jgi:hypothetical protein
MPGLETLKPLKKMLVPAVFAVALSAVIGFHAAEVSAQQDSRLWTIVVHLEYQNGTEYDIPIATEVPTSLVPAYLGECGRSHWTGTVVRYHCYPIPE